MEDWIRDGLMQHAAHWQLGLALVVQREQRRRNSAVRQLRWSDIDLEEQSVRWRPEHDKRGRGNVTPLSVRAAEALKKAPSRGIGETPVFPSAEDSAQPTSRNSFQVWLRRTKAAWLSSIEDETECQRVRQALRGLGYHGEKRAGVRDRRFRQLPAAIQEEIAGTNYTTLRRIYDSVSVEDMREAWSDAQRKTQ
jgi:integrase